MFQEQHVKICSLTHTAPASATSSESSKCKICTEFEVHKEFYRASREEYQNDKELAKKCLDKNNIFSVDMQKVVLLPHLPGLKESIFTPRMVTINESFAPVGTFRTTKPAGYLWNESIAGRADEDLSSVFVKAILHFGCEYTVLWADNCGGQNKNWTLYGSMVWLVNSGQGQNTITIKYLTKGHTFMSADVFHKDVEKVWKTQRNVFTFDDFVQLVNRVGTAIPLNHTDFFCWPKIFSQSKSCLETRPLLAEVVMVQFRKNSTSMFYKKSYNTTDFTEVPFLTKASQKIYSEAGKTPPYKCNTKPRGISLSKKTGIQKLLQYMPDDKVGHWEGIPANDESYDMLNRQ